MESLYQALIIPPLAVSSERGANIRRSMKNETTVIPASTAQGRILANGRRRLATIKQFARYAVGIAFAIALIYVVLAVNGVAVPHWATQETTATKTTEQDASGNSAAKMTTEYGERARSSETAPSRSSTQSLATTQSATTAGNTTEQTTQAVKQSKDTQQSKPKQNTQTSENKSNKSSDTKTATTESKDAFIALPEDDAYDSFSD
jgi:hypothetical protein